MGGEQSLRSLRVGEKVKVVFDLWSNMPVDFEVVRAESGGQSNLSNQEFVWGVYHCAVPVYIVAVHIAD